MLVACITRHCIIRNSSRPTSKKQSQQTTLCTGFTTHLNKVYIHHMPKCWDFLLTIYNFAIHIWSIVNDGKCQQVCLFGHGVLMNTIKSIFAWHIIEGWGNKHKKYTKNVQTPPTLKHCISFTYWSALWQITNVSENPQNY